MAEELSLQDRYDPGGRCFGCGPSNEKGLQIKSFVAGDEVVMTYRPEPHHVAFEGVVNGGIIGTLFDCHCNWTAAYHLMLENDLDQPPPTVTAEFAVKLRRPTPMGTELLLRARPTAVEGNRATVEAEMEADGVVTATCTGRFVAVEEGHPAFRRWSKAG